MKFGAAIETGNTGLWYGRLLGLPGTHARAGSLDELLNELKQETAYHDMWLRRHGEPAINLDDVTVEIVEFVDDVELLGESGGMVALFESDLEQPTESHIQQCIKYMSYQRIDLLKLISGLSPEQLNHTPPSKKRNIIQILGHICNAEEWYISRLGPEAEKTYEQNLGITVEQADKLPIDERMKLVRASCVKMLQEVIPEKKGVFTRAEYTSYPEEQWTAGKVLRRFLEHEREHICNIRWYLGRDIRGFP